MSENNTNGTATAEKTDDKVVDDRKPLLVKVSPDLHRGVRVLAALTDQSITDVVVSVLEAAVKESGADKVKLPTKK